MNESTGINGEIRVVDEFVCTAISHDVPQSQSIGRGENAGFRMTTDPESPCGPSGDELRRLSTQVLHSLVVLEGSRLPPETLKLIHDIALERLSADQANRDQKASVLSNIVMEQAVARIVSSAT